MEYYILYDNQTPKTNLKTIRNQFDIETNTIIAIQDCCMFGKSFMRYEIIGNNIKDCFSLNNDFHQHWFINTMNFRKNSYDGNTRCDWLTYRERKENITDRQWNNFLKKIIHNQLNIQVINKYTNSLQPRIRKVLNIWL